MYCTKCGSVLEAGRCPNCDFVDDTVTAVAKQPKRSKKSAKKPKGPKVIERQPIERQPKERKPLSKKKKIIIFVSAAAFLILAGVGAFLTVYLLKDAQYNDAVKLLRRDKLEAAAASFEELEDFKNSPEFLEETLTMIDYFEAKDVLDDGNYKDAISLFAKLEGYKDSRALEELAQQHFDYEEANALFDAGAFEQAKVAYLALGNFEDSIANVQTCQIRLDYDEAKSLYASQQYLQAKNIFATIIDYQDSADMVFTCECLLTYEDALEKIDNELYSAAVNTLKKLDSDISHSSINFTEIIPKREIKYYIGVAYFEQDLFYSAYQEFKKATGFLDASSMAEQCKQPIVTKELYENPDYDRNSVKFTTYGPKEDGYSACVKVYTEDDILISIYLVANNEKLRIYFPKGTYYFDVSYGKEWFGKEEAFGTKVYRTGPERLRTTRYYTWKL